MNDISDKKKQLFSAMQYFLLFASVQVFTSLFVCGIALARAKQSIPALDNAQYLSDFAVKFGIEITLVSTILTFLILYSICIFKKINCKTLCGFGGKLPVSKGLDCLIVGLAANVWISFVVQILPFSAEQVSQYSKAVGVVQRDVGLISIITVVILAPILEEIIFRGIIQTKLKNIVGVVMSIVLQAILFGGLHTGLLWAAYAGFLALVMGYLKECTGSLKASMLFHIGFNGASILLAALLTFAPDSSVLFFPISTIIFLFGMSSLSKTKAE